MGQDKKNILCVNGGSSSIKFPVYSIDGEECVLKGKIDRIGLDGASLTFSDNSTKEDGR
jgi:acetate kinase